VATRRRSGRLNLGKGKTAVRRETKTAVFLNKPQRHYSRKDAIMQNNNFPKRRYYTEADAQARADEIVAERLAEIIDKSSENSEKCQEK